MKPHAELLKNESIPVSAKLDRTEAPPTPTSRLVGLPPEIMASVRDQMAKAMSLKVMDNVSEMRLQLKPESLGQVTINVRMEEGSMVARIDVSQPQVRAAMEANLPQLRDALVTRGIQVDRIDILMASNSSSRESSNQSREKGKPSSKRRTEVDSVDAYDSTRYLGYNTMEYLI
jgi:flagellar hook-length control protein FliK